MTSCVIKMMPWMASTLRKSGVWMQLLTIELVHALRHTRMVTQNLHISLLIMAEGQMIGPHCLVPVFCLGIGVNEY